MSRRTDVIPREFAYLKRWAEARRRSAWYGIDRGVAPPPARLPACQFTVEHFADVAVRQLR